MNSPFDLSVLRTCYIRKIREHHPDRFYGQPTKYSEATETTKQLNLAFQHLSEYLEDLGGVYTFAGTTRTQTTRPSRASSPRYTYKGEQYAEGFPDKSVTEIFLKSSHIISTGYSRAEHILYIKFKGNSVYRYYDVPSTIFDAFLAAESHGKFAHANIYKAFRYEPA